MANTIITSVEGITSFTRAKAVKLFCLSLNQNIVIYPLHVEIEFITLLLYMRQKDCLWKQSTHYGLENVSLGFIETLHKQS